MGELARIKIGPWTATPALNLLERGEQSVKIESRAMDVLVVLARHDGAVVSVEELIAAVWKGVVVGDGSVYLAIRQLRQALGDSADGERYIETIPKRGYRLTVPAKPDLVPAQAVAPAATGRPERAFRRWLGAGFVGAVIVTAAVAGIVFALRDGTPPSTDGSVAVLPFANLSSDPEQAYFADGVTAEILDALSRVRGLRVTGRISSFQFKNRDESSGTIGAALGVEHLVEGSVRKAGDQVRITAQLSNARTGQQLWYETYERTLDDIFSIQDEIANSVANALQVKLGVGDVGRSPGMTRNVAAYDEYLRGVALLDGREESVPLRLAHLQRAVALDPSFSIAWALLAGIYTNGAILVPSRADEWRRQGDDALAQARALTPDAPHVLLATAIVETRRGHWLEAAPLFKRMDASYSQYGVTQRAWEARGSFLAYVGRLREAIPVLERARSEDPFAPDVAGLLSLAYTGDGNFTAAFAEIDRGLALESPDTPFLRLGMLVAFSARDRQEIDERLRALPGVPPQMLRLMDTPAEALAEIRQLASTASPLDKSALSFWAAYFEAPELSLELWSEGTRDVSGLWLPLMRDVRRLPAFKDAVREMGLVDYWRADGWPDFCRPLGVEDFACS